jgi:peptidoglycan/xylan/chitin deacetylase (PgdA/CDA1 family)
MSGSSCAVVFYHYVRDVAETAFPRMKALSVADFETQLDWLQARRRIVSYPDFEAAVLERRPFSFPAALLTFDDGLVDHYERAFASMRRRGVTGVFFLTGAVIDEPKTLLNVHKTHLLLASLGADRFAGEIRDRLNGDGTASGASVDRFRGPGVYRYDAGPEVSAKRLLNYELPVAVADRLLDGMFREFLGEPSHYANELYLSAAMIRDMSDAGMTFGFHGERHRLLSRLDVEAQRAELSHGIRKIRDLTAQETVPFCYPYGHPGTYTPDTVGILRQTGYPTAFTAVRGPVREPLEPLELPRFDTRDLPPCGDLALDA